MTARLIRLTVAAASGSYVSNRLQEIASASFSADLATGMGVNELLTYNGGTGGNRPAFNASGSADAPNYTLLDWTGKSHFDPVNNEWWYCAGTVGWSSGAQTMIRYSVGSNTFRHWQGVDYADTTTSVFQQYGNSHNFDSAAFDPTRRNIYRLIQANGYGRIGYWNVDTKSGGTWYVGIGASPYCSMEAFPGINALCVFLNEGYTLIRRYSMDTGATLANWTKPGGINKPATCYYNGRIYFTGDSLGFYALEQNGSVTTLANTPVQMTANGQGISFPGESPAYTHTILCHIGSYIYAFQLTPATSGYVPGVYRYDPVGGAWVNTNSTNIPATRGQKFLAGPLRSEGCALIITSPANDTVSACHLWKP